MEWHYVKGEQSVGPVTESELKALLAQEEINSSTLVWKEGEPNWIPYEQAFRVIPPRTDALHHSDPPTPLMSGKVHHCVSCGKTVTAMEAISISGNWVCSACKPAYLQKVREGVTLPGVFHYAGFWIRTGAVILDGIIMAIVTVPMGYLIRLLIPITDHKDISKVLLVAGLTWGISILLHLLYQVFFLGKYGATPGKMACGIKVVRPDGSPITYARAAGRFFAYLLSALILYIGYIMAGFDDEKRALHDRICDTRVIYKNKD